MDSCTPYIMCPVKGHIKTDIYTYLIYNVSFNILIKTDKSVKKVHVVIIKKNIITNLKNNTL